MKGAARKGVKEENIVAIVEVIVATQANHRQREPLMSAVRFGCQQQFGAIGSNGSTLRGKALLETLPHRISWP
jgi:hypothetical protein